MRAKGFEVFPLAPGSKKPSQGSHGLTDATSDVGQVAEWCREYPFANIGLRTGPGSGVCAIDLDPLKGGFDSERHLRSDGKHWPITPVQRTRSGGRHIILQHHPLIITGSNRSAVESISEAPGAIRLFFYSWLCWPACGPAPAPQWLLDHLAAEAAKRCAEDQAREGQAPRGA